MDRIERLTMMPLVRDDHMVACVDYQVCDCCGFRLMRVETTLINAQPLIVKDCPICHQSGKSCADNKAFILSDREVLQSFDAWLAEHNLDRAVLEQHYHLKTEDFFDLV